MTVHADFTQTTPAQRRATRVGLAAEAVVASYIHELTAAGAGPSDQPQGVAAARAPIHHRRRSLTAGAVAARRRPMPPCDGRRAFATA